MLGGLCYVLCGKEGGGMREWSWEEGNLGRMDGWMDGCFARLALFDFVLFFGGGTELSFSFSFVGFFVMKVGNCFIVSSALVHALLLASLVDFAN